MNVSTVWYFFAFTFFFYDTASVPLMIYKKLLETVESISDGDPGHGRIVPKDCHGGICVSLFFFILLRMSPICGVPIGRL